jgi:hypothetical protein
MSNLLFSERELPPVTLNLHGVMLDEIEALPQNMRRITGTVSVGAYKGRRYIHVALSNGVFVDRKGDVWQTARMDGPMLSDKVANGIPITAWRFSDLHPSFSAALRRAEWLRHIEYDWAGKVQTVFELVVSYNDSWDDNDSWLEKQWLTLARAAEVAMGKKAKFEPTCYSDPFIRALVDLYPEEAGGTHVDLAQRWLQDPTPTVRPRT